MRSYFVSCFDLFSNTDLLIEVGVRGGRTAHQGVGWVIWSLLGIPGAGGEEERVRSKGEEEKGGGGAHQAGGLGGSSRCVFLQQTRCLLVFKFLLRDLLMKVQLDVKPRTLKNAVCDFCSMFCSICVCVYIYVYMLCDKSVQLCLTLRAHGL